MGFLDEAASMAALRAALDKAVRRRGGPGPDGVTLAQFAANTEAELARLRDSLLSGTYRPHPARRILYPKPGGGHRTLAGRASRDLVEGTAA
jgi:RNA-directed DNA polymerase